LKRVAVGRRWSALALTVGIAFGAPGPALSAQDAWPLLRVMEPGPARAEALCLALEKGPLGLDPGHWLGLLELSHQAFLEELKRFAGAPARRVAEAMHRASPAIWSSLCVEGVARRMGDLERSTEVLESALARTGNADSLLELRERLAIVCAGWGRNAQQLDWLGRALVLGGDDGLQMRGRLALSEQQSSRARALFRVLVDRSRGPLPSLKEPPPWALRGWGLALLPPAPESAVPSGASPGASVPSRRNSPPPRD
jgi:hypothetical protein